MKRTLLLVLTSIIALYTAGQNTSVKIISKSSLQVLNGTTDTIYGDGAVFEVKREYKAVMESQDSMLVGIKRVELSFISGTKDYFCWYLCYQPVVAGTKPNWYADDSLWLYQDDTISNFSVYINPLGLLGVANYRYVFYPENNPGDSSWVDVVFDVATLGTKELVQLEIGIFPNPASDVVIIDIPVEMQGIGMRAEIIDLSGRMVKTQVVHPGKNEFLLPSSIESGSYVVRVLSNDKLFKTLPLVIH